MLAILAAIAKQERVRLSERVQVGLSRAKAQGKKGDAPRRRTVFCTTIFACAVPQADVRRATDGQSRPRSARLPVAIKTVILSGGGERPRGEEPHLVDDLL